MTTFQLDTSGRVLALPNAPQAAPAYVWSDLSPFAQGYVEAAFASASLRVLIKRRTFKAANHQQVYDWYLANQPDAERSKGRGAIGNGYSVGLANASDREFAVRNSLAYAGWAAGHDLAKGRPAGFQDLAPATLAAMLKDCEAALRVYKADAEWNTPKLGAAFWEGRAAGRGDYPRDGFPPLTLYLGDDGLIYQWEAG